MKLKLYKTTSDNFRATLNYLMSVGGKAPIDMYYDPEESYLFINANGQIRATQWVSYLYDQVITLPTPEPTPPHVLLTIENHGSFILPFQTSPSLEDIDTIADDIVELKEGSFFQIINPDGVTQTCIPAKIFRENIFHLKLVN
jgi:hypothetical protein